MGLAMEHGGAYARTGDSARGCWYYLRYFFLFASLIQSLIILGLVLFMVYGNVHVTTESNLQATKNRTEVLYGQVVQLSAARANLSRQLNLTTQASDADAQRLLGARRDLDRINASFRQCQADLVTYKIMQEYIVAIILSEKQCQEQLKETNKTCDALMLKLGEKGKTQEMELVKEKATCAKDKEVLGLRQRAVEEQLAECRKTREQRQQEQQVAEEQLRKVQALCVPLDKDKLVTELSRVWQDLILLRTPNSLSYHYPAMGSELTTVQWTCDHMPNLMASKVEELARGLRTGIERVARENAELQRQRLEAERRLQAGQEAREKAEKEAQAREAKLRGEYAQQTQLVQEEKATLRKERDNLAKELEARKWEVEQLKMQVDIRIDALNSCLRGKSQPVPLPRPVGPVPQPPAIDPAALEEFKRRILESQRPPAAIPAAPSSG